ncbi:MAG: tRNA (guanine-N(1)-)-methyltransferase [candidate division CPR2 bacterium GW2011_GWC2_39_10]|uniref:tRNA (guanine-N(1)-)-methyltransferase n=1 Tax=candidate division CPR2 bacterium GW2011_GWC2_39_10 TaxID=1618345 RepID=A0A0G0LMZ0_UNCC2|nr:MAG: tRNA (guanine-N(1)-)-methyltransferase [candidate division CPR2 bacterium GW2011_GWC2_39_10]
MIKFHILTLFPDLFSGFLKESILARAQKQGLIEIYVYNLRDWGIGKHNQVDDSPYGGGTGMVIMMEPIDVAIKEITKDWMPKKNRKILLTPQGKIYNQKKAEDLSKYENVLLICGRYEGFDERIRALVDEELSIGNYILNGGEVAAMAVVESVFRLLPGVLTKEEATRIETFHDGLLEYPQYTRPEDYYGKKVPPVLLSGNHAKIEKWRHEQAVKKTIEKRPDLLDGRD